MVGPPLTCCHLNHISLGTHAPCLPFKLLSDNCAWHVFATGWWQTQYCHFVADLVMPVFPALISGRQRQLAHALSLLFSIYSHSVLRLTSVFKVSTCLVLLSASESAKVLLSPGYICFSARTACLWLSIN